MIVEADIEIVLGCEDRLLRVWPAVRTEMMDGWAVRFANGYSGRANSASAQVPGSRLEPTLLKRIETFYARCNLVPHVRVTPFVEASATSVLTAHGYRIKDEAIAMMLDFGTRTYVADPRVVQSARPERHWLQGLSLHQESSKRNPDHLLAIVGQIKPPVSFATIFDDGYAVAAIDGGWAEIGSVMIAADVRGKGLGRAIISTLLHWAQGEGAVRAFLQVDAANEVAIGLYRSLGFVEVYRYETWWKTDVVQSTLTESLINGPRFS